MFEFAVFGSWLTISAEPLSAGQFWKLLGAVQRLECLLTMEAAEALRVRTLLDATRAFAFERERLEEAGTAIVSAIEIRFLSVLVERLESNCPPVLVVAGPIEKLSDGRLSIAGHAMRPTKRSKQPGRPPRPQSIMDGLSSRG